MSDRQAMERIHKVPKVLVLLGTAILAALGCRFSQENTPAVTPSPTPSSPADTDCPFAEYQFEVDGNEWDLGHGEYFIALLNDSCEHCQEIVHGLNELQWQLPDLPPIVALILGEEETLRQFRDDLKPEFPTFLIPPLEFFELIGDAPPRFVVIRDGKALHHWDEELPDELELMKMLHSV